MNLAHIAGYLPTLAGEVAAIQTTFVARPGEAGISMIIYIEGFRVFIKTQTKSQTVDICTAENRRGWYQKVYRLRPPFVTAEEVAAQPTLDALDQWLRGRGADDEGPRESPTGVPAAPATMPDEHLDDIWLTHATRTVGAAINALVWDFAVHPYMHRVESSFHARLFSILVAHPIFAHQLPIGSSGRYTQPVHREWPRNQSDGGPSTRGRFDLAMFSAAQMAEATPELFEDGQLTPAIAIEMGMDPTYPLDHLTKDHQSLADSGVTEGFLVHLSRKEHRNTDVETFLSDTSRRFQTAYAHHANGICTFRTLDGEVRQVRAETERLSCHQPADL